MPSRPKPDSLTRNSRGEKKCIDCLRRLSLEYLYQLAQQRNIYIDDDFLGAPLFMNTTLTQKTAEVATRLEESLGIPYEEHPLPPLENLMLTLLSQNTNDANRDKAYHRLRQRFPDWNDVMEADVEHVADAIRVAGLSNQKSQRMQAILRWIFQTYGRLNLDFICRMDPQEVIDTFCQLKGIGIKTISVVLAFSCGVDIFPVDTHVHRLCNRIGLVRPKTNSAEQTFALMQDRVPAGKSFSFHINLIHYGRSTCRARKPLCQDCCIRELCDYYREQKHS